MITRRPVLRRWTEQAEAEQMCALAMFEREPQNLAAACPVAVAPRFVSMRRAPALLSRLRGWFGGTNLQIVRDEHR